MAALYVHVPFRRSGRLYDQAYYVTAGSPKFDDVARALASEVRQLADRSGGEMSIETLYLGGGRPGLLSPDSMRAILDAIRSSFDGAGLQEVTIELTPGEVTEDRLDALENMGITRVSLEGLSFANEDLLALGAPHSAGSLSDAVQRLERSSLASFSLDLAFGHAGQGLANWKSSLHRAIELGAPHLTIHEVGTSGEADEPDPADCLAFAITCLKASGYEQYELTHFARPGHASHHQRNYYAHGDYFGVGPSAESFRWTDRSDPTTARRWANVGDVSEYVGRLKRGKSPTSWCRQHDRTILAREYILLRVRTEEGLDLDVLATRYGVDLRSQHGGRLARMETEGLIRIEGDLLQLTDRGRLVTDAITERLLPD